MTQRSPSHLPGRTPRGAVVAALVAVSILAGAPIGCGRADSTAAVPAFEELGPLLPRSGRTAPVALAPGDRHRYTLDLAAGVLVRLEVEQRGVDAVVSLVAPDGDEMLRVDSPIGSVGEESLLAATKSDGAHRLVVEGIGRSSGSYAVVVVEMRTADALDRRRAAAFAAFAGAEQGRLRRDPSGCRSGVPKYRRALRGYRELGDEAPGVAAALAGLGECLSVSGEPRAGAERLAEAVAAYHALGMPREEGWAQMRRAEALIRAGDPEGAESAYRAALARFRATGNQPAEAIALNDLGVFYEETGELEQGLSHFEGSLAVRRRLGDEAAGVATVLNLGELYLRIGYSAEAIDRLEHALELARARGQGGLEVDALRTLGWAYYLDIDPAQALAYYEAALARTRALGDEVRRTGILDRRGSALAALGRFDEAEADYRAALSLFDELGGGGGATLANLGSLALRRGDPATARALLIEAREKLHDAGDPGGEAAALVELAEAERRLGTPEQALGRLNRAIHLIESMRGGLRGGDARSVFLSARGEAYERAVDLLLELDRNRPHRGYAVQALEIAEREKARQLLDDLARSHSTGAAAFRSTAQERVVLTRLRAAEAERLRLVRREASEERVASVERTLRSLRLEVDRARAAAGGPAAVTPIGVEEILGLVDSETQLVIYTLGAERGHAWVVSTTGVEVRQLDRRRSEIETLTRRLAANLESSDEPLTRSQAEVDAAALADAVIAPVADLLTADRLAIVPDGPLHVVPFDALPWPGGGGDPAGGSAKPLLERFEVTSVPSASVLALLRREHSARRAFRGTIAVVADPVFGPDDDRLTPASDGLAPHQGPASESLRRAVRDLGLGQFGRLRETAREAEQILALVPPAGGYSVTGFEADRGTVAGGALAGFGTVHFATHGIAHPLLPDLSGLVLSLVDRQGRSQDGFLRAHEIAGLELDAELVVLSACRTGVGRRLAGEGPLSLTRPFLHGGARRAVVTYWDVDDRGAAELMTRFHRARLIDGLSDVAALRAAKLSMRSEPRWSAPAFWAAFGLHGDWR